MEIQDIESDRRSFGRQETISYTPAKPPNFNAQRKVGQKQPRVA